MDNISPSKMLFEVFHIRKPRYDTDKIKLKKAFPDIILPSNRIPDIVIIQEFQA